MEALRVLPPDHYVGAVESIPLDIAAIERLAERGAVYPVEGDLYFEVHDDPTFGSVASLAEDEMLRIFAERGGDPDRPGRGIRSTACCGRGRSPGTPRGTRRSGGGVRAGTSSAPRSRSSTSAVRSTSREVAETWPSRTTR